MAIVVPLLLLLVFGILDFGIFLYRNIELTQGVREAGRQGAVALYDGGNAACNVGPPTQNLVCLTKERSGCARHGSLRDGAEQHGRLAVRRLRDLPVERRSPGSSQPFLPKYIHAETIMRLEQAPTERG